MQPGRWRTVSFVGRTGVGWALAMVVLVTTACSDGRGSQTGATVPPGDTFPTSTTVATTTTAAVESYDVPEVIDQAYVQRVVSAYDKVLGDAIRVLKRDGAVTEEFLGYLVGLYSESQFEFQQRLWVEAVAMGDLAKRPDVPGDPRTAVLRLVKADRTCVIAQIQRDFSATLLAGVAQDESPEDDYVVLVPGDGSRDPRRVNPTPWSLSFDGFKLSNEPPLNSCGD